MARKAADERQLTRSLERFFRSDDERVLVGIGDDAAVLRTQGRSVLCTDPVVEGVHFRREDPAGLVGRKAVNRNLADLAAMGARPLGLLLSLVLPSWVDAAWRRKLLGGVRKAAQEGGCPVVGGDVCHAPGRLVVTVTALGDAPRRPLRRDQLAAGDQLFVSGALGGSILGKHLRFSPPVGLGRWLARQSAVRGAMDISDGLALDLATMLQASGGLGAELEAAAIPRSRAAQQRAKESGRSALQHALQDGEDHELLFAVRGRLPVGGPLAAGRRQPIGVVTERPGLRLRHPDGEVETLQAKGYQHRV